MTSKRKSDLKQISGYYKKKFTWFNRCVYCGGPNQCRDHVFPVKVAAQLDLKRPNVRKELGTGLVTVPCCNECNSLAGDNVFTSVYQKRLYIKEKLKKKYSGKAKQVLWDIEELEEVGFTLKTHVLRKMSELADIEKRLSWPNEKTRVESTVTGEILEYSRKGKRLK